MIEAPICGDSQLTVGDYIADRIRKRGGSLAAFARDTDVSYEFLNAVIHNREKLSIAIALKVAPALGLDPFDLLGMQLKQKIELVRKKMAPRAKAPEPLEVRAPGLKKEHEQADDG